MVRQLAAQMISYLSLTGLLTGPVAQAIECERLSAV